VQRTAAAAFFDKKAGYEYHKFEYDSTAERIVVFTSCCHFILSFGSRISKSSIFFIQLYIYILLCMAQQQINLNMKNLAMLENAAVQCAAVPCTAGYKYPAE
jgi:hypothetical protein